MFEFKLPDLGEGVHEGQIVNILVAEGDTIAEYQPMLEVETDKAAVEIPAPKGGVVAKIHVESGQTVKVGDVLISIDEAGGGAAKPAAKAKEPTKVEAAAAPAQEKAPAKTAPAPVPAAEAAPAVARRMSDGPVAAAPAVRKLARKLDVDIDQVAGTGPGGRVLREDVEQFAAGGARVAAPAPVGAPVGPAPDGELPDFSQYGPVRREPVPQIRKTIARQMTRAWLNVPRVTHTDIADVTDLERNRKAFNVRTCARGSRS